MPKSLQSLTLRRTEVEKPTDWHGHTFIPSFVRKCNYYSKQAYIDLFLINIYNFVRNGGLQFSVSVGPELINANLVCVGSGKAEHAFTFWGNKLVRRVSILQSYKPYRNRVGCSQSFDARNRLTSFYDASSSVPNTARYGGVSDLKCPKLHTVSRVNKGCRRVRNKGKEAGVKGLRIHFYFTEMILPICYKDQPII